MAFLYLPLWRNFYTFWRRKVPLWEGGTAIMTLSWYWVWWQSCTRFDQVEILWHGRGCVPRVRDVEALWFQTLHLFDPDQHAASLLPLGEWSAPQSREWLLTRCFPTPAFHCKIILVSEMEKVKGRTKTYTAFKSVLRNGTCARARIEQGDRKLYFTL